MADKVVLDGELSPVLPFDGDFSLDIPLAGELGIVTQTGGGGGSAVLIDKTITANGTYNATADSADGYKKVIASVPNTYGPGDEGKVVESGALVSQTAAEYTENGDYDTTTVNSVSVNVQGGSIAQGLEITGLTESGAVAAATWHGDVPGYGLSYWCYGMAGTYPTVSFDGTETIGNNGLNMGRINLDIPSLSGVKYAVGGYSFSIYSDNNNNHSSETLSLPEFTGLQSEGGSPSTDVFRTTATTYFKGYYLPKMTKVGQYSWYQHKVANIEVQIGSIGYGVTSIGQRPFGGATGSGTITVYCTGANLDTLKTAITNSAGANYHFTFKASENTTYGGNTYQAGDTILTV